MRKIFKSLKLRMAFKMDPCGASEPQTSYLPKTENFSFLSFFSAELVMEAGDIGLHAGMKKLWGKTS